ncbi:MAG: flagellar basal body-associated protein FliL [Gammaproteobacteria bacterium MedPE]|nr:MAG: flagellar basal body-associated protein FliL [Gammaproteobacteria bacterium MedPE]
MAEEAVEEAQGGSKKLLIIIIAVVVLIAGGAGAFFFLSGSDEPTDPEMSLEEGAELDADVSEESADEGEAETGDAFYVGMPRPFVFNVPGYGRDRLVQIKVQLMVRGGDHDTIARKHIPLIEDTLLTTFSTSNAEKLSTNEGKQELRKESLAAVQQALEPLVGKPVVEKVLFIGFVMQ